MKRVMLQLALLAAFVALARAGQPGGLGDERQPDDNVRELLAKLRPDVERLAEARYESLEPLAYRKQVVAGANYFIKALATAKDGSKSHIHVRLYQPFKGAPELTAIKKDQPKEAALAYFQ